MANDWTPSQLDAVNARGMQVLVSAAAGSGKTTVLTERVKNILSDTNNPCAVSELLVVTFTKAAASEMRDRIHKALKGSIDLTNDKSGYLRRQIVLLPTADICTMDSFCSKIVKENFSKAGVGFDFRILDNKDIDLITSRSVDVVVEELYESDDDDFKCLINMFIGEKNDNLLKSVIVKLHEFSLSYPFPHKWLESLEASFDTEKEPGDTVWADVIYKHIGMFAEYHLSRLSECAAMMEESGGFNPDFVNKFIGSSDKLKALIDCVNNKAWDSMVSLIRNDLLCYSSGRNTKVDESLKNLAMDVYKDFSDDVGRIEKHALPLVSEHKRDNGLLYPVVRKLCYAVGRLSAIQEEMKQEMNAYSFADILHKCINLLVEPCEDGSWVRTELCNSLRNKYKEILIDEYQDTNEAQNMIFEAISRDKSNLYVVGDVKQSIYGFRMASPALFTGLKDELTDYDGSKKPSLITLDANFRSRKGIDDTVNFLFSSLMSRDVGDIDYDDKEKLSFGATWFPPKNTPDTEVICIDCNKMKAADITITEAEVVADNIERLIKSGVKITTKNGERPIRYGDICVLLRSVKERVDTYVNALKKRDIPYCTVVDGDTSDYKEIRVLISIIKAIYNPMLDVSLIASMVSPVFGFTADELAEIRLTNKNAELFSCLVKYSEINPKAKAFVGKINLYRNIAASYPVDEFVRFVVDDTCIEDIYVACDCGDVRKGNIRGFVRFAEDFVKNSDDGLGAFVRYIDNAVENGRLSSSPDSIDSDGIKFMSIHKSKGLEFPYVILAGCSKGFNKQDSYGSIVLSRETGIGLKIRDDESFTKYHTVSSAGTELATLYSGASEELRVLYVALTRAKEHLTFVCSVSGNQLQKRIKSNNILSCDLNNKFHPFAVYKAGSMSEWILSCFAQHRDCAGLRDLLNMKLIDEAETDFSVDCTCVSGDIAELDEELPVIDKPCEPDYELLELIRDKLSYDYGYKSDGILAKRTASSTEKKGIKREYFASSKPDFMKERFTGADRGNAFHKFLEVCDFKSARDDFSSEKERLLASGLINEKEADVVDGDSVSKFFDADVCVRMLKSDNILKEYEFSILKRVGDMYPDVSDAYVDEDIVVQGKLDCAFFENDGAVLIDYKTDSLADEKSFIDMYKPQIDVYAEALSLCCDVNVKERYLYSFKLGKFIKV